MEKENIKVSKNLYEIRVSVTGECNYQCIYCGPFQDGKKTFGYDKLSLKQIKKIANFIKPYRLHVQLTGGEPSLRRDLDKIIKIFVTLGISDIGISTNGSCLDRKYINKIVKAGVKNIHFHIPSLNQRIYQKTMKCTKRVKNIIQTALFASKYIKVKFNTPVTPLNFNYIENLLNFVYKNKIDIRLIEEVTISSNRITKKQIEERLLKWLRKNKINFKKRKTKPNEYGIIYTTKNMEIKITPMTPYLVSRLKGKETPLLYDGRFWVGANKDLYVFAPTLFIEPRKGTFKDFVTCFKKTYKIYQNYKRGYKNVK